VRSVFFVLISLASSAAAQMERPQIDRPDPLIFAPRLVEAINGRNLEKRKELLHPRSLACLTPQTRPHLDEALRAQFRHLVPPRHKVRAETMAADRPLPEGVEFPIQPTHEIHVDYDTGPNRGVVIVAFLTYSDGRWREVWPCVKPEKVPEMEAAKAARLQHEQRVKTLAASMPQALRGDVLRLAGAGRKIEAIQHYQRATGENLAIAKAVVDLITAQ
jgi:hypothetical protein